MESGGRFYFTEVSTSERLHQVGEGLGWGERKRLG